MFFFYSACKTQPNPPAPQPPRIYALPFMSPSKTPYKQAQGLHKQNFTVEQYKKLKAPLLCIELAVYEFFGWRFATEFH